MLAKIKKIVRQLQFRAEQLGQPRVAKAYKLAVEQGLFDLQWYEAHCGKFPHALAAFKDYIDKSRFSNVNPSANFDTEFYMRVNGDIYHHGMSPLLHYMFHGRNEGRISSPAIHRWQGVDELVPVNSASWKSQKIAICLHIFYADFIAKFAQCLQQFPCSVDVFVAVSSDKLKQQAETVFGKIPTVNKVLVVVAPNRGRNFGPLLVEFGEALLKYDLMCHLHSKKSLYSGREQTQWFDYLNQYLFRDKHMVKSILRLFDTNAELGMYYPTSFWMMPSWVNNWTCNKSFAKEFVTDWGIDITENFVNYPVGGMFWARPKALEPLLSQKFTYDDFPAEPLANDGSWLHALERIVGLLAENQGYKQFFYYPAIGKFTTDKSHIFMNYHKGPVSLFNDLNNFNVVSFDVFDTVLRREFTEPEYAKFKLGQHMVSLGLFNSANAFIKARNEAEFQIRKNKEFRNDVSIIEIYSKLAETFNWQEKDTNQYCELEFEYDLQMIKAKDEMVSLVNQLHDAGREIWFITDIYYTKQQIETMLRKIGMAIPYRLFVSSDLGLRKDAGTMWTFIKELIHKENKSYIHVGDNVRSDAQICGDFGLANMHILHPVDKWQAAGYVPKLSSTETFDEKNVLKWGKLIGNQGRYPFFGE